ncbi:hypothetical protein LCGC14_2538170 [marine sediment metagenome]|uniref:Uncharacterized protein n=1 Tax=marine sediment metagenome TaxID=412755 RepID=A0A0F9ARL9_9ZZZZ
MAKDYRGRSIRNIKLEDREQEVIDNNRLWWIVVVSVVAFVVCVTALYILRRM